MGTNDLNFIGQSIRRKEDVRFLTGVGQYTDDVNPPHHTHAYFLRSPHAHAKIGKIDLSNAKSAPGAVAIYTGADLTGVNGLPCGWLNIVNNRLIPNAIEPRAAVASYSRGDESYTLYVTSQNPHVERLLMTAFVLGLPETKVRVIAPDVGGGFGSKIYLYPEETAMV